MRISDWCSDVCSSDLEALFPRRQDERFDHRLFRLRLRNRASRAMRIVEPADKPSPPSPPRRIRALDRKSVGQGKRVSVRVTIGRRWIIEKETKTKLLNI